MNGVIEEHYHTSTFTFQDVSEALRGARLMEQQGWKLLMQEPQENGTYKVVFGKDADDHHPTQIGPVQSPA